ncbi:translation initiation factor IF-2 N-terminal domain-containing protein [Aldersonia kunmingensis]|uniref:translation initiation factor IF-2 N-terminal domain-containing protein n=1 Tax=Aldersonia kunmingensis TaxID=408066 RepID=UPI000832CD52|nr:translation initiation factor IF-2 N-terminal domain-containing protein [Aldersonia kunmingensis]
MADREPPETFEQPSESAEQTAQPPASSPEEQPLPDRIRVHALAKLLGVTSKRVLARLTEMGSEARSAQSSLNRDVAESVRDSFTESAEPAAPAAAVAEPSAKTAGDTAGGDESQAPAAAVPQLFSRNLGAEPEATPIAATAPAYDMQAPLFLPPAPAEPTRRSRKRSEAPVEEKREEQDRTEEPETPTAEAEAEDDSESSQQRRRRRGRRGRGRGRGEQAGENETDESDEADTKADDAAKGDKKSAGAAESADGADAEAEDDEGDESGAGESSSRRRRRRRRRKVGGEGGADGAESSDDDPPNTVVHEREPRSKSKKDEVQGISGSTRLEAKRQRRRDGRDAGRRRPPILSESEFLARREAVDRVMVVREKTFDSDGGPASPVIQVAVLEDEVLVEHFVTTTSSGSMVGNVYRGRVQNVLPSMEAAFVDIGRGRNGVLYAGEVNWEAAGLGGKERKIEQALKPGDSVLVQVSKDPVGHKGARLTTQISLAGRFLVYVPGGSSTGISRKLPDTERKRLKEILRDIVPADAGVIIRTASEGVSAEELGRDVERLQSQWRTIEEQSSDTGKGNGPQALYEEPDLLVKVVRDLFNEDFSKLIIEGDNAWTTIEMYVRTVAPDLLARVNRYEGKGVDVFTAHRIDEQLAKALERKVWLPSGGTLVIDRTEAMTVVDVNTGKFTGAGGNLEETVTRNNLEAAEEIVRQMRLRDIGGMIVVDFIDMVLESNRDLVLRRLTEALGRDRTRHQVSEVTSLGLVQMTRKKLGTGLVEAFSSTCEHCHGRGIVVHSYPVEASGGEDSGTRGGGRSETPRRRRGKDKSAAAAPVADTNAAPAASDKSGDADSQAKRAHPVALAMAAHHAHDHDHDDEHAAEAPAEANAAAEAPAEAVVAEAETQVEVATSVATAEPPVEEAPAQPEAAEVVAEPVVADKPAREPAPAPAEAEPAAEPTAPARKPARRRVSRAASAPASEAAGTVFVISASETEQASEEPSAVAEALRSAPVVAPRERRRRSAGRQAGPPVDVEA